MRSSEHVDELCNALARFQSQPTVVPKSHTAKAGSYSYNYADLADTVAAAGPRAAECGLSVIQTPGWEHGLDMLTTRVCHVSGQWFEDTMRLFLRGEDPQSHGSAITYARRYAYCAALGIVADEDDDGAAATHVEQNQSGSGPIVQSRRVQHSTVRPAPQSAGHVEKTGDPYDAGKASDKQVALLKKLSKEKGVPVDEPEKLTKGAASKVIESLMQMQAHVAPDPVAEAFPGSTYEPDEEPF